jgi:hypothetical protein
MYFEDTFKIRKTERAKSEEAHIKGHISVGVRQGNKFGPFPHSIWPPAAKIDLRAGKE